MLSSLDLDLVVVFGTVIFTALVARWTQLPVTALEILAGIVLVSLFSFTLPSGTDSLLVVGSLLIVFLAGLETNFDYLRRHLRRAFTVGLAGFLIPFVGLFLLFDLGLHGPLLIDLIGAAALADTSISIVYTTLQQYELADLPFGRFVLASTLAVNLAEDVTITTTTFASTPGFVFTLAVLGALTAAALLLPRFARIVSGPSPQHSFTNVPARVLLFSLAILALLSALVGVPGILFVFLMGLLFSRWSSQQFMADIRRLAFALFVPLYFVAVGLKVDFSVVAANWPLLLLIAAVASALKIGTLYPIVRRLAGPARAGPIAVLMNTRLTSATVILLLTLTLGLITPAWYSLLITAVIILALASSASLRAFTAFRGIATARALFASSETDEEEVLPTRVPARKGIGASPPLAGNS